MTKNRFVILAAALASSPLFVIYHEKIFAGIFARLVWIAQWLTTATPVYGWVLVLLSPLALTGLLVLCRPLLVSSGPDEWVVDDVTWRREEYGDLAGFCGDCGMRLVKNQLPDQLFCEKCQQPAGKIFGRYGYDEYERGVRREIEWQINHDKKKPETI